MILSKKVVKLDIDGVIRNFHEAFIRTVREIKGNIPGLNNLTNGSIHYNLWNAIGWTEKEFNDFIHNKYSRLVFYEYPLPYQGALDFIGKLSNSHYFIILITHQSLNSSIYTIKWLEKFNIRYDYFCFSNVSGYKYLLGKFPLVDDKPSNLKYEMDILVKRSWNKNSDWKNIAETYDQIFDKLEKFYNS